jgi:hypothetical protein
MTEEGKSSHMGLTPERIAKLCELGFEFSPENRLAAVWAERHKRIFDEGYQLLAAFKWQHGHCLVPTSEKNPLSKFVANCRRKYFDMTKEGTSSHMGLTPERIAKLRELGFEFRPENGAWAVWAERHAKNFDEGYQRLVEFKRQHGHCLVTTSETTPLSKFVANCRRKHLEMTKAGKSDYMGLTPERIAKLQEIGFEFKSENGVWADKHEKNFDEGYQQLVEFKRQNGHCLVSTTDKTPLSKFVATCRKKYLEMMKAGQTAYMGLTTERITKLQALGFEFRPENRLAAVWAEWHEKNFDEGYLLLVEFKRQHGHCLVPTSERTPLAKFVANCRKKYLDMTKEGKSPYKGLTSERIDKLVGLGFEFKPGDSTRTLGKAKN